MTLPWHNRLETYATRNIPFVPSPKLRLHMCSGMLGLLTAMSGPTSTLGFGIFTVWA